MDPVLNLSAPRVIRVASASLGQAEEDAVVRVIRSGQISQGPEVAKFEEEFATSHGLEHGVACCSGTSALQLALAGLRIGPTDRVLVPSCTMIAVPNAVLYVGATPIFCDSDPRDGNPTLSREAISERPTAVIAPHLYGQPAERFLDSIEESLPGVKVIEDCAEAHFANYSRGRPVGRRSHAACFSTYGNKCLTTGEGGMVLTDNARLAERMQNLRAHAFTPGDHFHHTELAYGMRLTDLQAAVGRVQLSRKAELMGRRAEIAAQYIAGLKSAPWIVLPERTPGAVWWVFPIVVRDDAPADRDELRALLAGLGVETRTYFYPLHKQAHLRRYATQDCPVADFLGDHGMYLPLHPCMSDDDVRYVVDFIRSL